MKTWNVVNDDGRVLGSGYKSIDVAIAMREVIEAERGIFCYVVEAEGAQYVVIAEGADGKTGIAGTYDNKQEAEGLAGFTCGEVVTM